MGPGSGSMGSGPGSMGSGSGSGSGGMGSGSGPTTQLTVRDVVLNMIEVSLLKNARPPPLPQIQHQPPKVNFIAKF